MPAPKSLLKGFEKVVATAKPDPRKRIAIGDPDTRGLFVRITPKGHRSYAAIARNPDKKQVWAALGDCDDISLEQAREKARAVVRRIKQGETPFPPEEARIAPQTFKQVTDNFLIRYVDKQKLRTGHETKRIFRVYVEPVWGSRAFTSIRRSDVSALLDGVEDNNGPVMADRVLSALSKLFNWYAARSDDFVSPIVRGMRRVNAKDRTRERILNDDEIRKLWAGADKSGAFGSFAKMLLLTAQRRAKVRGMRHADISDEGLWTIPTDDREKSSAGSIQLSPMARAVLKEILPVKDNEFVFAGRGKVAIAPGTKLKASLDKECGVTDWTLHDLRRTAKSLMSRANVRPDISERVLGHVIAGVEGIYDRHSYDDEKAKALEALAGLVSLILDPPTGNVVELRKEGAA